MKYDILLIDDDFRYRNFIVELFNEIGYTIQSFSTASESINHMSNSTDDYRIILIDYNLTFDYDNGDKYYDIIKNLNKDYNGKVFIVSAFSIDDRFILKRDIVSFVETFFDKEYERIINKNNKGEFHGKLYC